MPVLLNADSSFSSKQELLDLEDPPNGEASVNSSSPVDSHTDSPIGSAPRSPLSFGADGSPQSGIFTGATSFQGQFYELGVTQCGHSPMDVDSEQLCGWGTLKPKVIQVFNTPSWLVFFFSVAAFLQGIIINGFVSIIVTSIERRFDLSSSQTGLIVSSYDIASCICLAFVSYFGGNGHKPRWLGWGVVVMGVGSLVFALPHFTTPPYQVSMPEYTDICSVNSTIYSQNNGDPGLSNYRFVFILAQFLHGFGASPFFTLGTTFLDENVKSQNSPVYLGIFYTAAMLGPPAGFMIGGYLLSIFTEIQPPSSEITPANPRWVGAWWLGFILAGTMCLLVAIPILGYPKKLPGSQSQSAESPVSETRQIKDGRHNTASDPQFGKTLKDMPRSLLLLMKNPTFVFLCLAGATDATLVAGLGAFMPKFLESQFNLSSSKAAVFFGLIVVPATGGGTFFGGYIVKRFQLNCQGIIRFCIACALVGVLTEFIFLIECPTVSMAGVTTPYPTNQGEKHTLYEEPGRLQLKCSSIHNRLTAHCNANCSCTKEQFKPVCGTDGLTYYSPCYAGCTAINDTLHFSEQLRFIDCSCVVANTSWSHRGMAVKGKCGSSCSYMEVFIVIIIIPMTSIFLCNIPALTATLRCVPERQKPFALGIQWILVRTLGSIPGPIVFGFLIDRTCLLWQKDGQQGSCYLYKNTDMSVSILIVCGIYKFLGLVFFCLAGVLYKPSPELPENSTENTTGGLNNLHTAPPEDGAIVKQQTRL